MPKPSERTATVRGKRGAVLAWLGEQAPDTITLSDFAALRERFAPISERRLRDILRESGASLHPIVEGVRQTSLEELERSLRNLLQEYQSEPKAVRRLVIQAKDHAKLSLRKADATRRVVKEEMILWMLTWLENPAVFPEWVALRKRAAAALRPPEEGLY